MPQGYHNDPVIQSMNLLGQTIHQGQANLGQIELNAARERMATASDAQQAPVRELAAAEAQDELTRRKQGVRVLDVFPDDWSLELATWQPEKKDGKVKPGEPTLLKKFGDMFGASVDTQEGSPNYGFFVKEDGSRLSHAEINRAAPQVEALFVANMGIGRTIRMGKEKIEAQQQEIAKGLEAGQISAEEAQAATAELQAAYDDLTAKGADPAAKIKAMEQQILFLQQFSGKEIEKGISRLQASIKDQQSALDKKLDREQRTVEIQSRESIEAARLTSDQELAYRRERHDKEITQMKIDADKDLTKIKTGAENFDNLPPEAKLAHWYAGEINKGRGDKEKVSPAEAWESIQASKNFKSAVDAYNNFIQSNWTSDKDEMRRIEGQARKMFLDNLTPASKKGKKKDWREVPTTRGNGSPTE